MSDLYKVTRMQRGTKGLIVSQSSYASTCLFTYILNMSFIARRIDSSSVLWTLIDNGTLANQIARLAAIVVKYSVSYRVRLQFLMCGYFPKQTHQTMKNTIQ